MTREEIIQNKANLSCANLEEANLSCANLFKANLFKANLEEANLSCANLFKANLEEANLEEANLSCANLGEANLSCANLKHVDARGLCMDEEKEILFRMDCCIWPVTIWHDVVSIGCKNFTFDQILEMTEENAEEIHAGAGKRWNRWGDVLKTAIKSIQEPGI